MAKLAIDNSRKSQGKGWIYLLCGALIPVGVGVYLLKKDAEATPIERQAARSMDVPPRAFHEIGLICDKAEAKHIISEDEWQVLSRAFHDKNQKVLAIGPLMFLRPDFIHKAEAVAMLTTYISEGHKEGNVVAAIGLKKLGDPRWKEEAAKLMISSDPAVREPANRAFAKFFKK